MNTAQRVHAVSGKVKVKISSGVVLAFRPALAGEAAAAGLLPTDTKMVSKMDKEEYEAYEEMILERAKPLILSCGVDPVWVEGEGDPENGIASYEILEKEEDDILLCYLAIMGGVSDAVDALYSQFPSADRDQATIAIVSQAFGMNPLEVELLPLPEWIRLLRYGKLCGAVKVKGKEGE